MKLYATTLTRLLILAAVAIAGVIGWLVYLGWIAPIDPEAIYNARGAILLAGLIYLLTRPSKTRSINQRIKSPYYGN